MAVFRIKWPYMSTKSKKMAVLKALQDHQAHLGSLELQKLLGADYPERTLRRWLNEMVSEGLVLRLGQKRATQYQAVVQAVHAFFGEHASQALDHVRRPLFERDPVTYHKAWLDAYHPNQSFYLDEKTKAQLH